MPVEFKARRDATPLFTMAHYGQKGPKCPFLYRLQDRMSLAGRKLTRGLTGLQKRIIYGARLESEPKHG